jgi:hypothetical protein
MKVHLLVSELYRYQNARCNNEKKTVLIVSNTLKKLLCCEQIQDEELKMVLYPVDRRRMTSEMHGRIVASSSSSRESQYL